MHSESFAAALAPVTVNGTVGLGTFYRVALDWLKSLALAQVDTEAERDDIVEVVLKAADALVGTKFPFGWTIVRASIQSFLDDAIDQLPTLLA